MKRATATRYPKKIDDTSSSNRKGFSSTVSLSNDGRRMIAKSKAVELLPKPPPPGPSHESIPQSDLLATMLEDVRRRTQASQADEGFHLDARELERDFYETNAGGYDDDYVATNNDNEIDVEAGETICGVNEDGQVIQLTEEDGRKARHFASVSPLSFW